MAAALIMAGVFFPKGTLTDLTGGRDPTLPWGSNGDGITITCPSYVWKSDLFSRNNQLLMINLELTNDKDVSVLTSTYDMLEDSDYGGHTCRYPTTSDGVTVNAYFISTPYLPDRLSAHATYSFSVTFQVPNDLTVTKPQYSDYPSWYDPEVERFDIWLGTITAPS